MAGRDPIKKHIIRNSVTPKEFLIEFMRCGRETEVPKVKFSGFPCDASKAADIADPLCQWIKDARICPGYQLIDPSKSFSFANNEDHMKHLLLFPTGLDFWQSPADSCDEDESSEDLERLIEHVATQFNRQHRTHAFSLVIFGRYARFLRWDRAACVVSNSFDYHNSPKWLVHFLWRFSIFSRAKRGFDPTATDATPSEVRAFKAAVRKFIKTAPRNADFLMPSLEDDYPVYKVEVESSNGEKMHVVIGKPFHGYKRPTCGGRGTRAYAAYLPSEKRVVCLKDFWRPGCPDYPSEAEVYQHLQDHDVPNLPTVLAAGDVSVGDRCQLTRNQRHRDIWGFIHQRIVQQIAFPLHTAKSSRELIQVFRDVVACMSRAYSSAQVLHQDISEANVMITGEGRGILNDWDSSWRKTAESPESKGRVGTWRFLSIHFCKNPFKTHEIHDDLESCFWVLIWMAVRYVKSTP
ncbi:unnamed protein product [Somion occarium]|uniref:Protein kinase domain-containing protein n=1 Tax=Somion occarium TaxID=3059160 RepID=A0ABP1CQD2_9APHY